MTEKIAATIKMIENDKVPITIHNELADAAWLLRQTGSRRSRSANPG